MSKPVNENNVKGITQYWYRGRPNYVNRPHSNRHVNACKELNRLLDRIAELEAREREAHNFGYESAVADSEDYDHDPKEMEADSWNEWLETMDGKEG